jgi:hypothetical protein
MGSVRVSAMLFMLALVEPAAKADQRGGGAVDVADAVQQSPPAA